MSNQNNSACFGTQRSAHDTKRRSTYRFRAATVVVAMASTALAGTSATAGAAAPKHDAKNAFQQVNLVSDLPEMVTRMKKPDPDLKNPWGIAMGPHTPLWVNNMQFSPTDKITLYKGATNDVDPVEKLGLVVEASAPTGMVFNPTSSFKVTQNGVKAPATFLFNEAMPDPTDPTGERPIGEITGWRNATPQPTTTTHTDATKPGAFYTGLALVPGKSTRPGKNGPRLLAANSAKGTIDVYDSKFKPLSKKGAFVDPHTKKDHIPPYNVTFLKDRVYVAYFDFLNFDSPRFAPGSALSVFTKEGKFIKRLVKAKVTGNPLNAPWGMAVAPNNWGRFGGAILVGNVLSGEIKAFNRRNGHLLGTIKDAANKPLVNGGLWGLAFGNGTIGTPRTLLFSAGIGKDPKDANDPEIYQHGLLGLIKPINDKP